MRNGNILKILVSVILGACCFWSCAGTDAALKAGAGGGTEKPTAKVTALKREKIEGKATVEGKEAALSSLGEYLRRSAGELRRDRTTGEAMRHPVVYYSEAYGGYVFSVTD